ncbi:hypothetical protein ACSBR1_019786 [Camellia fascicularis]
MAASAMFRHPYPISVTANYPFHGSSRVFFFIFPLYIGQNSSTTWPTPSQLLAIFWKALVLEAESNPASKPLVIWLNGELETAPEFSYSGSTSPDKWGSLSPRYTTCSNGKSQSPIDIVTSKVVRNKSLKPLRR